MRQWHNAYANRIPIGLDLLSESRGEMTRCPGFALRTNRVSVGMKEDELRVDGRELGGESMVVHAYPILYMFMFLKISIRKSLRK